MGKKPKGKGAFYYFAEDTNLTSIPAFMDEAVDRVEALDKEQPFIGGLTYGDRFEKAADAYEGYWQNKHDVDWDVYKEGMNNIRDQFKTASAASGEYRDVPYDVAFRRELNALEAGNPVKQKGEFDIVGDRLQSSETMTDTYDTVYNIPVPYGDTDTFYNTLDTIPKGSDIGLGFHSGHRFSGIDLGNVTDSISAAQPNSLYMMTCHGDNCIKRSGLADANVYFRGGGEWQGVYPEGDNVLSVLYGRHKGEVYKNPKEGVQYNLIPKGN